MNKIGGNTTLTLTAKTSEYTLNEIGERIPTVNVVKELRGYLDLSNGDIRKNTYNAKIEESTHIFICDYVDLAYKAGQVMATCNGNEYEVTLIDNPMGLNKHLEIYLKYVGE